MSHDKLLCPLEKKADIEIANQATVVEFLADFVKNQRSRITESDILQIHALTIEGIYPCAGNYRNALTQVSITDTDHQPAHPSQIRHEVNDMLEWLYGAGRSRGALHRAAHVLWKINNIHPFNGGNGRVARSVAYLVMVSEVAPIFAGEPLPAKLKKRKSEYVQGLKAADKGNLTPLQELVLECFQQQISEIQGPRLGPAHG
jgi:fido (protein-threonine AMPylation protein)